MVDLTEDGESSGEESGEEPDSAFFYFDNCGPMNVAV